MCAEKRALITDGKKFLSGSTERNSMQMNQNKSSFADDVGSSPLEYAKFYVNRSRNFSAVLHRFENRIYIAQHITLKVQGEIIFTRS